MYRLYNGDCLEVMKTEIPDKSIDMIMCDPPYGQTYATWDSIIPFDKLWEQYERIIKDNGAIVLTASQPFTTDVIVSNRKLFRYELIWAKNRGTQIFNAKKMPMKAHENILVFYKKLPTYNPQFTPGKPYKAKQGKQTGIHDLRNSETPIITENTGYRYPLSVLHFPSTNGRNIHPTEKPVELGEYLIKTYTNEGETILDNTFGSCAFGIAAINTNRNFIGIEKDEKYFKLGGDRMQARWNELEAGE